MKKSNHFNNVKINNFFWPVLVLIVLVIGAIWTNAGFIQQNLTAQKKVQNYLSAPNANFYPAQKATNSPAMTALLVQEDIARVVSMVRPSVVSVSSQTSPESKLNQTQGNGLNYLSPYTSNSRNLGSGVIIDVRGYVLTTFQTVGKEIIVKVTLYSGGQREYLADVVGVDTNTDLALLKIRGQGIFPTAVLANSDLLKVGDIVFAIGSPFGFQRSVTMGIISNNNRQLNINGVKYPDMIQTDAAINKGNDGGPLINIKGEIIGINMACYMPDNHFSGIGFAIPINDVLKFVDANI